VLVVNAGSTSLKLHLVDDGASEPVDDLEAAAGAVSPADAGQQLRRLEQAGERLEGNVSPELVLDDLALGWHRSAS